MGSLRLSHRHHHHNADLLFGLTATRSPNQPNEGTEMLSLKKPLTHKELYPLFGKLNVSPSIASLDM